jgi:hypothetical protein
MYREVRRVCNTSSSRLRFVKCLKEEEEEEEEEGGGGREGDM